MRIDMVAASWEAESAEHTAHIADLSAALSRQGHDVALHIRRHSPGLSESERTEHGYNLIRVPAGPANRLSKTALLPHLDEFSAFLDRGWAKRAPDVVHLHSWLSGLAVRESAAPLVQSSHGLKVVEHHLRQLIVRSRTDLQRLVALAADRVVAAGSEEMFALARIGVPSTRMSLVPWGVDTDRFSPDGPAAPRGTRHRVLALGDMAPGSGFATAISAMATIPDAELLIAGPVRSAELLDGPEVVRLAEHARRRRVTDRVRFTGRVHAADLPALLRSADVVVCAPWHESSGVAALQAMACGIPVVASAVGALTDIVIHDLTGSLVPPRDPVALGRALRELLEDPIKRDVYGISGTDRARARYSWDRITPEVLGTYRKTARYRRGDAIAEQ